MKNCFLFLLVFFISNMSIFSQARLKEPKLNEYSEQREEYLLLKGYSKIEYKDFNAIELFDSIYKEIYCEEYNDLIPNYILNYHMSDGLYYSMLYASNDEDSFPLLTYLIMNIDNNTYCFYKKNKNLEFEIIHWNGKNLSGEPSEEMFKVFY